MEIQKYNVILDDSNKNVLVEEFFRDYTGLDDLDSPKKVAEVMREVFGLPDKAEEYMYLICMNAGCEPVGFFEVAHGTHDRAAVGMREIFVRALLCGAADIAIAHNHPGGRCQPTKEDRLMTRRVQAAADLLGIVFCDHVIVSRNGYYSFAENGEIGKDLEVGAGDGTAGGRI